MLAIKKKRFWSKSTNNHHLKEEQILETYLVYKMVTIVINNYYIFKIFNNTSQISTLLNIATVR